MGQGQHRDSADAPVATPNLPAGQSTGVDRPAAGQNAPAGHVRQAVAPANEYKLTPHVEHAAMLLRPVAALNVPPAHCVATLMPVLGQYAPALQSVHTDRPATDHLPTAHEPVTATSPAVEQNEPAVQGAQTDAPGEALKVPAAQSMLAVIPVVGQTLPASQGVHDDRPVAGWYEPTGQATPRPSSAAEHFQPARHASQVLVSDAPAVVLIKPLAQMPLVTLKPVVAQNEPAGHGVHADWPVAGAYVPAAHTTHAVAWSV
jgi:hypothetical protein